MYLTVNVLRALNVLNMPKDASLAYLASLLFYLFFKEFYETTISATFNVTVVKATELRP